MVNIESQVLQNLTNRKREQPGIKMLDKHAFKAVFFGKQEYKTPSLFSLPPPPLLRVQNILPNNQHQQSPQCSNTIATHSRSAFYIEIEKQNNNDSNNKINRKKFRVLKWRIMPNS